MRAIDVPPSNYLTTGAAAKALGLSIRSVQQWVEDGRLDAWKTEGSHRRITRASVDAALRVRDAALLLAQQQAKLNVLVVEDDLNLLRLYQSHVAAWPFGAHLYMAPNGYEALVMMGEVKPDLLICDLRLPGINGFQVVRALCAMQQFKALQIVVVSGLPAPEIEAHGGVPERVEVMSKPIDFSRLQAIAQGLVDAQAATP